jgi:PAS domain S-box-containing protein
VNVEPENSAAAAVKILVVQGEPAALQATASALRSVGYEVIERSTGHTALAGALQADLVILDTDLPDIDGFEVCRRLRANPATALLPIVHLSASSAKSPDFMVGDAEGADTYLTRPVERPVLMATVRTLLFARQADRIRRETDAKLRTMFDLVPIAVAVLDGQFRYEGVNRAYCVLTGYRSEELIGTRVSNAPDSESDALFVTVAPHVEKSGRWEGELPLRRKDGSVVEVEWKIGKESISGACILVATDISQRLEAESQRGKLLASERAARVEAERSNRLKEEFLATLSHELRNPLNAILGWSTLLARSADLPANVMQGIQAIERNSKLQAKMIADLLDYAGISFGKMRLMAATVDPYVSVKAALDVVRSSAAAQDIELQVTYGSEPIRVEADPARLQQIVWNLLTNAIKFSPKGSRVLVSASRIDESFRLVVQDNGKGIAPNFLPRIFDRFSQQDATSTRSYGGLGLGLAIVKHLVELHGGSIQAFSAGEERGAAFTINLPLSKKELPLPPKETQRLRSYNLTGVNALVVEDDADARALTKRILSDAGATVIEAASAEAALKCVSTSGANILISDIGMADQDGYQLVRNLRALGYGADRLPAVALTAFARMQDRNQALAAGFQEHLVKPLDPQTLISRVAMLRPPRKSP